MKAFLNFITKVSKVGFWLSTLGVTVMTLLIVLDIILRLFGVPLLGTYEIIEIVMSIVVFASFAYTQTEKGHIHVTMFLVLMPTKMRFICYSLTSFVSTFLVGAITYAAFTYAGKLIEKGTSSGVLGIPFYPFYYLESLAMAIFTIIMLIDAIKTFIAIFNQDMAKEIQSTWV